MRRARQKKASLTNILYTCIPRYIQSASQPAKQPVSHRVNGNTGSMGAHTKRPDLSPLCNRWLFDFSSRFCRFLGTRSDDPPSHNFVRPRTHKFAATTHKSDVRARTYAGQIDDSRRSDQHSNRGETFDIYRRRRVNTISVQRERSFLLLGSTTLEEARDTLLRCSKLVDVTSSLFITTAAELRARSATSTGDRVETHIYVVIVCFFRPSPFFYLYAYLWKG